MNFDTVIQFADETVKIPYVIDVPISYLRRKRQTIKLKDSLMDSLEDSFYGVLDDIIFKLFGGYENLLKLRCEFLGRDDDRCNKLREILKEEVKGLVTVNGSVNIKRVEDLLTHYKNFDWENETITI